MINWIRDDVAEIEGVEYWCRPIGDRFHSEPGRFCLLKPRWEVERYVRVIQAWKPQRIVEVGTYDGASAALLFDLAQPERLATIDQRIAPSPALMDFITRRRLHDVLTAHCGVDQSDGERLQAILDDQFGADAIDLVIDDASHMVEPTRATFNALFPRLRPGGRYLIEDWSWAHTLLGDAAGRAQKPPLTIFVFELILACAHHPAMFANVEVSKNWAVVERGTGDVDASTFDLAECFGTRGRALINYS